MISTIISLITTFVGKPIMTGCPFRSYASIYKFNTLFNILPFQIIIKAQDYTNLQLFVKIFFLIVLVGQKHTFLVIYIDRIAIIAQKKSMSAHPTLKILALSFARNGFMEKWQADYITRIISQPINRHQYISCTDFWAYT